MSELAPTTITATTAMRNVLREFPGAQRALFSKYHIGGCRSCAFHPEETIAELCTRNENIPANEVIDHIVASHEADRSISIEPSDLSALLASPFCPQPSSIFAPAKNLKRFSFSTPSSTARTSSTKPFSRGIEKNRSSSVTTPASGASTAVAYLAGHGFANVRCLRGGIDAYSQEADSRIPRYRIEAE